MQIAASTATKINDNKNEYYHQKTLIEEAVTEAWKVISPWWPLKNLIATNPLRGLEDLPFEQALHQSMRYFQNNQLQEYMAEANREMIKWCQVFFDEGQASINMPGRNDGIYQAWRSLAIHDSNLHKNNSDRLKWMRQLPHDPFNVIEHCLKKLNVPPHQQTLFLTILLTTLPGWAGYIKYKTEWDQGYIKHKHPLCQTEYLAIRIIMVSLLLPAPLKLLSVFEHCDTAKMNTIFEKITREEAEYRNELMQQLANRISTTEPRDKISAQLVFCIDVRSEPFRRAIEAQGNYETFGFAGFFGLPVMVDDQRNNHKYATCPVLLAPKHTIKCRATPFSSNDINKQNKSTEYLPSKLYKSLKYHFITPYALAEAIGPWSGLWMIARTLFPGLSKRLNSIINHQSAHGHYLETDIPLNDQFNYAESALRSMGLTSNFAPIVVLCGHGSSTENNAYATALDCGACGGHDGFANAKILANILNNTTVRKHLTSKNIVISDETIFIAGLHNTTTDEVILYSQNDQASLMNKLIDDLKKAREVNCEARLQTLSGHKHLNNINMIQRRSNDWSETRPEWGLARNAAFIIGPRHITKPINLQGRTFLHSYQWQDDDNGSILAGILTAPMVVAQWINNQYLFSTIDNVAYGSGSKITHNITGKIGIMQGNASDLMHGLPLQSISMTDHTGYHQAMRLLTCIHAPKDRISKIISEQDILIKLFGNGWVNLSCLDPTDNRVYHLQRNLTWLPAYKTYES